jgi:subtilisin family serine protease
MHPGVEAFAETHPGARISVIFRTDGSADQLATEVTAEGATEVFALEMIGGVAASVTADQLDRLSHDDDVEWVALDAEMASSGKGESERERDRGGIKTAYPVAAGAPGAWSAGATGDGVTVAVIDSGISEHSDFQGRAHARFDMSSVSNGRQDRNGHGTYVAGIIGGRGKGYVGIAPASTS